jgi:RNA-directed DNA polymerase
MDVVKRQIKDYEVIWLIEVILKNHKTEISGKGMPIGNLTSQFFANVYLNEFDQFVKHTLKVKYYIRYVDDFIILHKDKKILENWKVEIDKFLKSTLKIELHPEKSMIVLLENGVTLLGFRVFRNHKLLKKSNSRRIWKRIERLREKYEKGEITLESAEKSLAGWLAYAKFANTYKFRRRVTERFEEKFQPKALK